LIYAMHYGLSNFSILSDPRRVPRMDCLCRAALSVSSRRSRRACRALELVSIASSAAIVEASQQVRAGQVDDDQLGRVGERMATARLNHFLLGTWLLLPQREDRDGSGVDSGFKCSEFSNDQPLRIGRQCPCGRDPTFVNERSWFALTIWSARTSKLAFLVDSSSLLHRSSKYNVRHFT